MEQPYSVFARIYDDIMSVIDYKKWALYIEKLALQFNNKLDSIVDLACGTGNISIILAQKGYRVWGIDQSEEMIARAQQKSQQKNLLFLAQDMREFKIAEPVDLVFCVFDSINYLLTAQDLEKTMRNVHQSLQDQGLFIFDFNTTTRIKKLKQGVQLYEGRNYTCFWEDKVDQEQAIWQVTLTIFLREGGENFRRFQERHLEQGYNIAEIEDVLFKSGFNILQCYDAFTFSSGQDDHDRIYMICQKAN